MSTLMAGIMHAGLHVHDACMLERMRIIIFARAIAFYERRIAPAAAESPSY